MEKWEAKIKKQDTLLHICTWKGQSNFTLEIFIQQHQKMYVSMQAYTKHVRYQLPNENTHIGYILDAIETGDAPLLAAMGSIEEDTVTSGKCNKFESAAAYILTKDPVANIRNNSNKCNQDQMYDNSTQGQGLGSKVGIGNTGVYFRYHTNHMS